MNEVVTRRHCAGRSLLVMTLTTILHVTRWWLRRPSACGGGQVCTRRGHGAQSAAGVSLHIYAFVSTSTTKLRVQLVEV